MTILEIILCTLLFAAAMIIIAIYRKYKQSLAYHKLDVKCGTDELGIRYETLLNSINVGIQIRDLDGVMLDANQASFDLFGIVDKEGYMKAQRSIDDFQFLTEQDKEKTRRFEPAMGYINYDFDKIPHEGYFQTTKSGTITVEIKFMPMYDKQGKLTGSISLLSDVTQNMLLNHKYENLYRQQETILSLLPVCVEIYDTDGWLIYQNQAGEKFFGADTVSHRINAKNNPNLPKGLIEKAMNGESANFLMEYDFDLIRKSRYFDSKCQGIHYFDVTTAPIVNDKGEMIYYACVVQDQTEIVQAKNNAEQVNRKLNMVIANSLIRPWDYDRQRGMIIHEIDLKDSLQETIMYDYKSFIHPDHHKQADKYWRLMQTGLDDSFSFEVQYRASIDASWRYGIISGGPFERDKEGVIKSYTGFVKDVTEWKTLTKELEELNQRNRLILDNAQSGFLYFTPDYRIQWENVSSTFANVDVARKYCEGTVCYREVYGLEVPCEDCPLTIAIDRGVSSHREFCMGGESHYDMLAVPIHSHGKLEGVAMRIDDITERKRITNELEQAKEKAEESSRLKSAFLANMSHEIRTPLNAIVGFSEIILSAETDEEKAEYRNIIATNSQILINLVNDILDLSKIESGYIELNRDKIDLNDVIREVSALFAFRLTSDVDLRSVMPYEYCVVEPVDKQRLIQIINNFISNAIKFTPEGSVTIGYEVLDSGIKIYVSDTGVGIRDEHKGNVFKRFHKLDSFAQGTGLGLSICKAIAEAMDGRVGFESQSGVGSTFWVWLPLRCQTTP